MPHPTYMRGASMIVRRENQFDEIKDMLAGLNKVFVLGCDTCVRRLHGGGQKEVGGGSHCG